MKIFADKEDEWKKSRKTYKSPIPEELKWQNWAADKDGCVPATCDDEVIYLLDPNDPDLLFFSNDGKAIPSIEEESEPWNFARTEVSIDIYHLNHTPLKDARLVVWNLCQRKIDQIKSINQKTHRTAGDNARIETIKTELREIMSKSSEFSAAALACIEKNRIRMTA